jgi:hypothetical protein
MLNMSFFDGSMDKEKLKEFIRETEKEIKYTHGLEFRKPTIHNKLISKEKALKIVEDYSFLDAMEMEDYLHLNTYSENDMW